MNNAFSKETLLQELSHPHSPFYFVNQKDHTVGYFKLNDRKAQTDVHDKNAMELERIYVCRPIRVGDRSMDVRTSKALAERPKRNTIWLGVWEKNISAIQFYEKQGFVKFDMHPYYHWTGQTNGLAHAIGFKYLVIIHKNI